MEKFLRRLHKSSRNSKFSYLLAAVGGECKNILNGDEKSWSESIKTDSAIVDCKFSPLHNVAKQNSIAEKFLKQAEDYVH